MTDDERIAHLMGEPAEGLDASERAELDDLRAVLSDPALWANPPDALEDRVVEAIEQEGGRYRATVRTLEPVSTRGRPRWAVAALAAAAVALVAVLAAGQLTKNGTPTGTRFQVALAAAAAPGPSGHATLTQTTAGWRIELDASGLPRLDNGAYYQAWLKNAAGILVPIGTFNEGGHITLWAGVSPADYPTLTVTAEAADGNQASSGNRVLAGTVTPVPREK